MGDIACEFGRGVFEGDFKGIDNGGDVFGYGISNFHGVDGECFGETIQEISAADFDFEFLFKGVGRSDLEFNIFGHQFADEEIVIFSATLDDGIIEFVAGDTARFTDDDAA